MQTDAIPYSLFGFVACISREKNYFVHNHKLTKIFENSKVITRWSAVTRSELGNNNKVYSGKERQKCIPEPANCPTSQSADSLV